MSQTSIREVLAMGSSRLSTFETARLDCEVLLSSVLKRGRDFVYAHPEQELSPAEIADFNSLLSKRLSGYPVAYLTGSREFWSVRLTVNRSTLIPRPETEHLVEAALKLTENRGRLDILDLGTGSGAIAIAMAKERPEDRITATDISSDALLTAMENSRANHLDDIRFIQSDWFSALAGIMFDLILCNPPYVESNDPGFSYGEIRYEPRIALDGGLGGIGAYLRIIPAAIKHLNHGGYLVLEHGHTQSGVIRQLLEDHHYGKISTYSDHSGQDRVSFAEVSH